MNIMDKTPAKITLHIDGMTWEQVREMIEERYGALMWDRKSTAYPTDSVVVRMAFAEPAGNVAQRAIGKAAPQQEAPAVGNSGFDHKTAADFLTGNTVSDEAMRKFVAASRWAHDDRVGLQATLLSVRRELASRDAEIALLKTALMDAEAAPKQDAPQNCTCPSGDGSLRWPCPAHPAPQQEAQEPVGHLRMGPKEEFVATQRVQAVYDIICDDADWPPKDEPQQHWEGWIARRIVERLFQEPVEREPLTDEAARKQGANHD